MARGHSAEPKSINDLRYLLERESPEGRIHLAALAMSYATGSSELAGRQAARRINHLRREHGVTDSDIVRVLQPNIVAIARRAAAS